jgi:uroporphyrinogen-III synthase
MINVLFTRSLNRDDIELAQKVGVKPVVQPLIGIQGLSGKEILRMHPNFWDVLLQSRAVAFTSQNAVDALLSPTKPVDGGSEMMNDEIDTERLILLLKKKPVYSVGESTADTLDEFGIMARFPEDYNGTTLAKMMQNDGVHTEVVHFCGDVRRPEFKNAMSQAGIIVHEIVVYQKMSYKIEVADSNLADYFAALKAVAFYSPSAVDAFFEQHLDDVFCGDFFAIGQTTATALEVRGIQPLIPRAPTSELLIRYIGKVLTSPETNS